MESTSAVSFVIAAEQGKQYVSTRKSFSIVKFTFAEVVSSTPFTRRGNGVFPESTTHDSSNITVNSVEISLPYSVIRCQGRQYSLCRVWSF